MSDEKAVARTDGHRTVQPVDAESLIAKAISKDVPIETMERLLAMRREIREEQARDAYFEDLTRFQKVCPVIPHDRTVRDKDGVKRYSYATLGQIIKIVHRKLTNYGFSYTIKTEQYDDAVEAICESHHTGGHMETTRFRVPIDPKAYMNNQQKVGATMTFAKRYAFCNAFGIMTGDDDTDGNGGSQDLPSAPEARKNTEKHIAMVHGFIDSLLMNNPFSPQLRTRFKTKANELADDANLAALESLHKTIENQVKKMKESK
jgi:hypothetical protein